MTCAIPTCVPKVRGVPFSHPSSTLKLRMIGNVGRVGAWVPTLALGHPPRTVCKRNHCLVQANVITGSVTCSLTLPLASPLFLSPLPPHVSLVLLFFPPDLQISSPYSSLFSPTH